MFRLVVKLRWVDKIKHVVRFGEIHPRCCKFVDIIIIIIIAIIIIIIIIITKSLTGVCLSTNNFFLKIIVTTWL